MNVPVEILADDAQYVAKDTFSPELAKQLKTLGKNLKTHTTLSTDGNKVQVDPSHPCRKCAGRKEIVLVVRDPKTIPPSEPPTSRAARRRLALEQRKNTKHPRRFRGRIAARCWACWTPPTA